jgi:hypothetical protein
VSLSSFQFTSSVSIHQALQAPKILLRLQTKERLGWKAPQAFIMDFVKNFTGGDNNNNNNNNQEQGSNQQNQQQQETSKQSGGGGFLGGLGDKLNSAAGGGRESEKNEDYLDKGNFPFTSLRQLHRIRLTQK